jgi:hypothetical protein
MTPTTLGKTGLESDDDSALTSLSDEDEDEEEEDSGGESKGDNEATVDDRGLEVLPEMPTDFVEWETVSVTLAISQGLYSEFSARLL